MLERRKKKMLCKRCNCEMVFKERKNGKDIFSCVNTQCENFDRDFERK